MIKQKTRELTNITEPENDKILPYTEMLQCDDQFIKLAKWNRGLTIGRKR